MSFDNKGNFGYALIATAPTPAASGTTLSVTAGYGARFPAAPFNTVVWPAGANPLIDNAEVVRVTNKGTGDNWTVTRAQEPQTGSISRSIAIGDQVMLAATAKTFTDIETVVTSNAADLVTAVKGMVPGGRLTLTTALAVTTADVTAAVTVFYTPYIHNQVPLYDGVSAWTRRTFAEISIAVPAIANQMYDVFVYDSAGVATLELTAWTSDSLRATALVKQDGRWVKTGATTRLYLGSFRTTAVAGQTESSFAKRFVWNYYNRVHRPMRVKEATDSWNYTTLTWRQANGAAANQLAVVIGVAEVMVRAEVMAVASNTNAGINIFTGVGKDSTATPAAESRVSLRNNYGANQTSIGVASLEDYPAAGYHFYTWLEQSAAVGTCTFYGDSGDATQTQSGIYGFCEG